jgi:hypothetical protein
MLTLRRWLACFLCPELAAEIDYLRAANTKLVLEKYNEERYLRDVRTE